MTSDQKLFSLYKALHAIVELPESKILENETLTKEIRSIVNSKNINSIVNDIRNDRYYEKQLSLNKPDTGLKPDSKEFLTLYSKYQAGAFNVISREAGVRYTKPTDTKTVQAYNAFIRKKGNPLASRAVKSLPETKLFAEAYNSIFSDRALQIGTANDPTFLQSYIDWSPYIWNYQAYLSIPTLDKTVDKPIALATKEIPEFIFEDDTLSELMDKHLKKLKINQKNKKMLLYSTCSPRGSLIVPINEEGRIRFNVFNDTQFTYATSQQYSQIDFRDNETGVSQLYCLGHLLQNEVTAHFLCPGFEPIFAIGKNKLWQLKDAAEAVYIFFYTIKVLCIRAQVMIQKWSGEGQTDSLVAALNKLTQHIDSKLSLSTAVNLPADAELQILQNNFSEGFAKIAPVVKEYQGMLAGIMADYFYGSDTAYAANSFNLNITHQNIRSEIQEAQLEPIYRFVINTILKNDVRFKKYSNEIDNFEIEFKSLYEPTEQEKIADDKGKIENLIAMSDNPGLEQLFKKEKTLRDEFTLQNLQDTNTENEVEDPKPGT